MHEEFSVINPEVLLVRHDIQLIFWREPRCRVKLATVLWLVDEQFGQGGWAPYVLTRRAGQRDWTARDRPARRWASDKSWLGGCHLHFNGEGTHHWTTEEVDVLIDDFKAEIVKLWQRA